MGFYLRLFSVLTLVGLGFWFGNEVRQGRMLFDPYGHGAERTRQQAIPLISAIRSFKELHDVYPCSLNQLVESGLISQIPLPVYGDGQWHYFKREEAAGCTLSFSAKSRYPVVYFSFDTDQWRVDE